MDKFNKNIYKELIDYLIENRDAKYALFHSKLLKNDKVNVIGIRMPELKKIALKISKNDYIGFIKYNKHIYYEETILHGLVISNLNYDIAIDLFDNYINYIDNWASCDSIISNFKKWNLTKGFIKINEYLKNDNPWINRVGIVLLLTYYINEEYIDKILEISNNVKSNDYYVKMANAWLISVCLVKYYDKTFNFLLNNNLDDWTHNKAIQKSLESFRIKNKDEIKKIKK